MKGVNVVINKEKREMIIRTAALFLLFSVIGWVYEWALCVSRGEGLFVNHGFCLGPWLPIYAVGGVPIILGFTALADHIKANAKSAALKRLVPLIMWALGSVLAAAVELAVTLIMDMVGADWHSLWQYDENFMNYQGRIALWPSMKFGFLILIAMYVVVPALDRVLDNTRDGGKKEKIRNGIVIALSLLFIIDFTVHLLIGSNYAEEL